MQDKPSAPAALKAPLFGVLTERMDNDEQRTLVLDLGSVRGATIRLLNQFRCRLQVEALSESLIALNTVGEFVDLPSAVARLLPEQLQADVVLCWDLPNYLGPPALTALMQGLQARLQPGTRVHMLICYSASRMPAQPGNYSPQSRDHLVFAPVTQEECDSPRYTPKSLAECMPGFVSEKAMLLKNGMQEFVFRRQ